jgi:Family of unknown function (DUF6286)
VRTVARVASVLVAAALAAGAILVVLEIVGAALDTGPIVLPYDEWYTHARADDWRSDDVRWILFAGAAIGLVLLWIALAPRRPDVLGVRESDAMTLHIKRRSLARSLHRTVQAVDTVDRSSVRLTHKAVRVRATTTHTDPDTLRATITQRLTDRLDRVELRTQPHVQVRVVARPRR